MSGNNLHIQVPKGISSDRTLLSCKANGFVDLWVKDDGSGRQKWNLNAFNQGEYNIMVSGGTDPGKKYLSCRKDHTVELVDKDDGSGRQRWYLMPVKSGGIPDYYHIMVVGGIDDGYVYLSSNADGSVVDLFKKDDGSGRQRFQILGFDLDE